MDLQIIVCIRRHVTLVYPIYPSLFAFQSEHNLEASCLLTLLVWARMWGEHCFVYFGKPFMNVRVLYTFVFFSYVGGRQLIFVWNLSLLTGGWCAPHKHTVLSKHSITAVNSLVRLRQCHVAINYLQFTTIVNKPVVTIFLLSTYLLLLDFVYWVVVFPPMVYYIQSLLYLQYEQSILNESALLFHFTGSDACRRAQTLVQKTRQLHKCGSPWNVAYG